MIFTKLESLVSFAKLRAQRGLYTGIANAANMRLINLCSHQLRIDAEVICRIIFTRDVGHHTSGWWKNPDYERCFHLSMSFSGCGKPLQFDRRQAEAIVRAFYGDHAAKVWIEGPYSPEGKLRDVWHYRLFCDEEWNPILPCGEVYSRSETPAGWKSFSEIHGFAPGREQAPFLMAGGDTP